MSRMRTSAVSYRNSSNSRRLVNVAPHAAATADISLWRIVAAFSRRDFGGLHEALGTVGKGDEMEGIAARLAAQHRAQAIHFIILVGHDGGDVRWVVLGKKPEASSW